MARALHKSWQNRRPGFTKRVRWYQGSESFFSIRLNFYDYDEGYECNLFYADAEVATLDYEAFIAGEKTVKQLMSEKGERA